MEDKNIKVSASPKARKFARELGVDINNIIGSERLGRVIEKDIKNFVASKIKNPKDFNTSKKNEDIKKQYNHSEFGDIQIKDLPRIKKIAALHLSNSWNTIPHVTNHDEADITELEEFRNSLKDNFTAEKIKLTPLSFVIKAIVASLKKFPIFNSSIDEENYQIILKKYFHIGIAVDTPHGLMVPKIRDADKFKISDLSQKLKEVSDKCRNLKIDKKEFQGGSITITSLGGIGGTFFTPIINPPEVAILGIGKIFQKDKSDKLILPLSLSYDHRIINGADAARFCNEIKENLGKNFAYNLSI